MAQGQTVGIGNRRSQRRMFAANLNRLVKQLEIGKNNGWNLNIIPDFIGMKLIETINASYHNRTVGQLDS